MADSSRTPGRADVERLARAQREAVRRARSELRKVFETVYNMYDDPAEQRDALLDLVPAIARKYGNVGSMAAAEWYERMRARWFRDRVDVDATYQPDDKAMRQTVRRLAGHLWPGGDGSPADPDAMLRGLYAAMDKWVKAGGRETIERAARQDPRKPRYARVPQGARTCAFCAMLAGRGFVYSSAEAAGGDMNSYHHDCDCEIIPSWDKKTPKIEGYDPDKLYKDYLKARDSLGRDNLTTEEILAAMREQDEYTDSVQSGAGSGLPPAPPKNHVSRHGGSWPHDPNEDIILSMRSEKDVPDSECERRQIAAGGPSPDIEKMYPQEIVFLERVKTVGEDIEWIPTRKDGHPRNDFKWLNHDGTLAELKSTAGIKYKNIAKRISDAVAVAQRHDVTKDVFVIDFGGSVVPEKLLNQLSRYNDTHADKIKELWVFDALGLRQIDL